MFYIRQQRVERIIIYLQCMAPAWYAFNNISDIIWKNYYQPYESWLNCIETLTYLHLLSLRIDVITFAWS